MLGHWVVYYKALSCSITHYVLSTIQFNYHTNIDLSYLLLLQVSALHIAVRAGHVDIVKLLIVHGDVNRPDQWGFSPLHYATIARNKEIVNILLSNGASATLER